MKSVMFPRDLFVWVEGQGEYRCRITTSDDFNELSHLEDDTYVATYKLVKIERLVCRAPALVPLRKHRGKMTKKRRHPTQRHKSRIKKRS